MASAVSTPTLCSSLSSTNKLRAARGLSSSVVYVPSHNSDLKFSGLCKFTQWSGLKNLGISILPIKLERKGGCRGKGAYASLFGVGAPEALVIGVVALLVFGPKGLAEVARNLGKTLRAFQPTIKELQEVSREFKSTLEREIGIDDIQNPNWNSTTSTKTPPSPPLDAVAKPTPQETEPNGSPSTGKAVSSEELLAITEEQLKAAALKQQQASAPPADKPSETESPVAEQQIDKPTSDTVLPDSPQEEAASASPSPGNPETNT